MWRSVGIVLAVSAALFAALTVWTNHTTAATHEQSHEFVQNAKSICDHAKPTRAGVRQAAREIAALDEPPNVHRAVARLELHWRRILTLPVDSKAYRAERKQLRLSAHLLNVTACKSVVPR